jgi:hypothetical protein
MKFKSDGEKRVGQDHPLIGLHVIVGAMRPGYKDIIEGQITRLLEMPSCGGDPDFWRVIPAGANIYNTKIPGFTAVRKLVPGDPERMISEGVLKYYEHAEM